MSEIGRKKIILTPWKVSAWGAVCSILFAIPYAMIPDLHTFNLPGDRSFATLYIVIFIPVTSFFWAAVGVMRQRIEGHLMWCYFSLVISTFSIAFIILASIIY
jgi:hypothetical protein